MFVLRLQNTELYVARKGCSDSSIIPGKYDHQLTRDIDKALPLGNLNTAKQRAKLYIKDQEFSADLFGAIKPIINLEIVEAQIQAFDIVSEITNE